MKQHKNSGQFNIVLVVLFAVATVVLAGLVFISAIFKPTEQPQQVYVAPAQQVNIDGAITVAESGVLSQTINIYFPDLYVNSLGENLTDDTTNFFKGLCYNPNRLWPENLVLPPNQYVLVICDDSAAEFWGVIDGVEGNFVIDGRANGISVAFPLEGFDLHLKQRNPQYSDLAEEYVVWMQNVPNNLKILLISEKRNDLQWDRLERKWAMYVYAAYK